MFGFGMPELIVILVILLVVFGPGKLPQLGASLGGAIRNFKKAQQEDGKVINPPGEGKHDQSEKDQ
ncbi:twin arginine translocase protein A [Geoanaerobacter pelophilus]|uniref:Sec-independent protein translocase protein TatA n=1 Tax=Geoanaerobacter pelophilus TaxID=60036 RepID=A0ABQ0MJ49_9BACT|nr:twin-arginine translocase TatA/TatE family subunit [Geoanaerobacter pelophilus]GAW67110.1 twin arginine translocase protein A [Geoanaerobacter pelophilus]